MHVTRSISICAYRGRTVLQFPITVTTFVMSVTYFLSAFKLKSRLGFSSSLVSYMGREGHNFATDLLKTNMMGQGVGREWW